MRFAPSKPALYALTTLAAALLLLILLPNSDNASAQQAATATPTRTVQEIICRDYPDDPTCFTPTPSPTINIQDICVHFPHYHTCNTPTPTNTPMPTGTNTPTPTNTPTLTPTVVRDDSGAPTTATPTVARDDSGAPTNTPTLTPTVARDDSGAPIPTPTPTATTTTTRADVPTPTPTRTATTVTTSGNANARISQLEALARRQQEQIQTQRGLIDSLRDLIIALTARFDEFVGVGGPTATPTPTHTPTATNTPVTALEHTPTPTTVPTATPTRTSRSTLNPGCIRTIGLGWLTGTWNADCQSTKTPPTAKEGTRYARYYAFTLDAPSRITVTVSSTDVRDTYLYLLRGSGNEGEIVNRGDTEIVEQLDTGTYTIEATTYNLETAGNFTLTLDIAATGVSAAAGAPR